MVAISVLILAAVFGIVAFIAMTQLKKPGSVDRTGPKRPELETRPGSASSGSLDHEPRTVH